jgi:hypothetical protein
MKHKLFFLATIVILFTVGAVFLFSQRSKTPLDTTELPSVAGENSSSVQYLAFQIFTGSLDSRTMRQGIPPPTKDITNTVDDIIRAIGNVGSKDRKLGFIPGPLALDNTNEEIRQLIRASFAIANEKNIAVGFHLDDSMFLGADFGAEQT